MAEPPPDAFIACPRTRALWDADPEIADLIAKEERYECDTIRLIPSENYASMAVLAATGSIFANKYSEGYASKRYYEGQIYVDQVEKLAIARACALFGAAHANVQPYSGSPANMAACFAVLKPNDTVMGLALPFGGHLTHGWNVNFSGILYRAVQYELDPQTHRIDMDKVRDAARRERPKAIFCGGTAYPRLWDFAAFRSIADEVGAVLIADIAHIAGLVAAGAHPSPVPHAQIVTTTTHKTLRGPRGAMILCTEELAKAVDRAVFPTLQGGPHNHTTAAIAVALKEAATPEFRAYGHHVVANAKALAAALAARGYRLVSGGTDNHLLLIDLSDRPYTGKDGAQALSRAGLVGNYNTVPFDTRKPFNPSGIRLGTPAVTSRGMKEEHMEAIAAWIDAVLSNIGDAERIAAIKEEVREFCGGFPTPGVLIGNDWSPLP
ncbi:MAG TPA: serine hydroxymethyltransferase [Planctomycetes bacterium]|nr:serine hydroxymethyltransferase [Planctomycetota bacterium]